MKAIKNTPVTLPDFTGGLNLADPPILLKSNQLLEATNWQYSDVGDGIETRDPVMVNAISAMLGGDEGVSYDPSDTSFHPVSLPAVDGVLFSVVGQKLYSFPSLLKDFGPGLYRCSDFIWMRLGVWNCINEGFWYGRSCDEFTEAVDFNSCAIIYNPFLYQLAYIGELTGDLEPIGAVWGDEKPDLLIASGGKLQLCRYGGTIETMTDSPDCTYVTKRDGRVLTNTLEYPSRLILSGVGDPSNWKQAGTSGWIDSDSIWIDVGYKSGGEISSIATLSKDLIIWKTNGVVYRMTGSYPDWAVYEIGQKVWNANPYCPVEAGGDLYFPDTFFGFSSIQTVIQYGEMRAGTVGYEVNKVVVQEMDMNARMWAVPSRGELWIKTHSGADYVYVYKLRTRGWTKLSFPLEVTGIVSVGNWTYVYMAGGSRTAAYLLGDHLIDAAADLYGEDIDVRSDYLFTGDIDYLNFLEENISQPDIEAVLKFPPLYANTGRNLLKHLVVDLWGTGIETEPGGGGEESPYSDLPYTGPWKWFKLTMTSGGHGDIYKAYIDQILVMQYPLDGDPWLTSEYPYLVSKNSMGTARASSELDKFDVQYPASNAFEEDPFTPWMSAETFTPHAEWIAFEFNEPTEFRYVYIRNVFEASESFELPLTGGDILVSNDSTDGVDGTWRTLKTGIFDTLNASSGGGGENPWYLQFFAALPGEYIEAYLKVPLSAQDIPATVYEYREDPPS